MSNALSKKLKLLSLFFTIWMVMYHSNFSPDSYSGILDAAVCGGTVKLIDSFAGTAMMYFFQTTAFLLYYNLSSENICDKLRRRIHTLLIPFILWNIIVAIFTTVVTRALPNLRAIAIGFSLEPFDTPLWYVLAVFVMSLLSPLIIYIKKKNSHITLLTLLSLIFVFIAVYASAGENITAAFTYGYYFSRLMIYIPSYILGTIIALYIPEILNKNVPAVSYCAILIITICAIFHISGLTFNYDIFIPSLFFLAIPDSSKILHITDKSIFKLSFIIYAVHWPGISCFRKLFHIAGLYPFNGLLALSMRLICTIGIVFVSFAVYTICKQIFPKLLSLLTGNRVV